MPKKNIFRKLVEGPGPRRPQEVVQLPHSRRPAPSRQPARRVAAALRGMRWCFGPSRSSPTSRRDSGPSRTRRRDCSRQGPLCSASDSSTPHTACTVHPLRSRHASGRTCAGRPAADSAGPTTWENGRHARAAQRGPRKIGQRYENVRRQSRELLYSIPAALCDEIAAAASET